MFQKRGTEFMKIVKEEHPLLEMRNISKNFEAVQALKNANLSLKKGEIRALLGSNGSGKSTLVKVLSGLVAPSGGEIYFDGQPVPIRNAKEARDLGIAVAYQDYSLIPKMSVLDNIMLSLAPCGRGGRIDEAGARETAQFYLNLLKIEVPLEAVVELLMPSTQSMIEIAKALALKPKILILDEATASLHSDEVDIVFEVLRKLKEEGTSVIVVTHRMNEIFRICDSCTILKSGETVAEGNIDQLDLDEIVFHMTGKYPDKTIGRKEAESNHGEKEAVLDIKAMTMPPKIKAVDFKAYQGEIVGIGGLDGQGQSEFIRAILADKKYSGGTIVYKGREIHYKSTADAVADGIGFISGDRSRESVFPLRSVAENLFAGDAAKGALLAYLPPKEIEDFAQQAMKDYGVVAGSSKHPANSLSGGNQQKLVIGRWIALSPQLLLLDDPTKGVDINSRQEIHRILRECVKNGMSVVYVSSDNEELLEIADRIYVFYEGRISALLEGADRAEEKLIAAMLGISGQAAEKGKTEDEKEA